MRRMGLVGTIAGLTLTSGLFGSCAETEGVSATQYRDSLGVEIVENFGPAWVGDEAWRLSPEPLIDIGAIDGSSEYLFGRAHGPVRLDDGRFVVADMQTNMMSFFDAEGRFVSTAGRTGEGPGEFTQLYRLRKIGGDSLMALSPPTQTSIFTAGGEYVRRFSLKDMPRRGNVWWIGWLEGPALLGLSLQREGTRELAPPAELEEGREYARFDVPERDEFYRDTLQHFLFTMEGELIDSIGKLPGQFLSENRTFAPNAAYAFRGDAFYHSPGNITEIRTFRLVTSADGRPQGVRLERIVRRPMLRGSDVAEGLKDQYVADQLERYRLLADQNPGFDMAAIERDLRDRRFPDAVPDHGNRMYADGAGNLWLQEYRPGTEEPFRWSVYDPDGRWLGVVQTPASFTVNEIGADYVLGIGKDEFDVDHVQMYRIEKPGS